MRAAESERLERVRLPRSQCPLPMAIEHLRVAHCLTDVDEVGAHAEALSASTKRCAALADDAGFCPVISRPSCTKYGLQSGPLE